MADPVTPTDAQHTVELDNGIVLAGMGGDLETMRIAFDERAEERAGEPVEAEATPAVAEPATTEPAKAARGPKRYAELTRQREDAERATAAEKSAREAAEAKVRELEARLSAPPAPVAAAPVTAAPTVRARPQEADIAAGKYATYDAFIEDLSRWVSEGERIETLKQLDARTTASIEADRASRNRQQLADDAFVRGRAAYSDFDAMLNRSEVKAVLLPPAQQLALLSLPNAEHVMYELAKNEPELKRIATLTDPVQIGIAFGQIIPRAAVAQPASTAPVVRTAVPAPPQPVGASTRTTSPSSADLAVKGGDDYDSSGYRERRAAELGRPRR
jgi:hypothetical protein